MRFKLHECVDIRLARLFEDAGHDAETVFSEKVAGATDKALYDLRGLVNHVIFFLLKENPIGHLWVVSKTRVRIWPA